MQRRGLFHIREILGEVALVAEIHPMMHPNWRFWGRCLLLDSRGNVTIKRVSLYTQWASSKWKCVLYHYTHDFLATHTCPAPLMDCTIISLFLCQKAKHAERKQTNLQTSTYSENTHAHYSSNIS